MATITKRISANGAVSYRVQIRLKGHPPDSATFERLTDAKRWATETEAAIRQGRYFGITRRRTFADLVEAYTKWIDGRLKSADARKGHFDYWSQKFPGTLDEVTPEAIAAAYTELHKSGRSAATANRYLASLSACFSYAVRELGWIDKNPCARVRKLREDSGRVRYLTDGERVRLVAALKQSRNPYIYTAFVLAITTGARQGEIMGLRWDQIDFHRRTILLRDGETKNNEGRVLPLVGEAHDLLLRMSKVRKIDDARVFPVPSEGRPFASLREAWRRALARAEIEDFRWHDLRHSAASYLTMAGVGAAQVGKLLGHKTPQMTARYSHLAPEHVVELGETLARRLGLG